LSYDSGLCGVGVEFETMRRITGSVAPKGKCNTAIYFVTRAIPRELVGE